MVAAGASIDLVQRLLGRSATVERPITVDQTNYSVVVDESFIVKWLQPPVSVPHPGVETIRHLAAAGFDEMPSLLAAAEHDGNVHAIISAYLPGAVDGWEWYVDDVDKWLAVDDAVDVLGPARRMGAITSRLHSALADLDAAIVDVRPVVEQAIADMHLAKARLDGLEWLDEGRVRDALQPLLDTGRVDGHRIHGDLHAGQFLRSGPVMLVTDFDGNPLGDQTRRRLAQSPLRDVASLVQSLEHVAAIVVKRRRPHQRIAAERFAREATAAALQAYTADHPIDNDLLHGFRVAQELHEYAYSIHHLPHWRYVADAALPALLGM